MQAHTAVFTVSTATADKLSPVWRAADAASGRQWMEAVSYIGFPGLVIQNQLPYGELLSPCSPDAPSPAEAPWPLYRCSKHATKSNETGPLLSHSLSLSPIHLSIHRTIYTCIYRGRRLQLNGHQSMSDLPETSLNRVQGSFAQPSRNTGVKAFRSEKALQLARRNKKSVMGRS